MRKIDTAIFLKVCNITDWLTDKTGYDNFFFAKLAFIIGGIITEVILLLELALDKGIGSHTFDFLFLLIWNFILYRRWKLFDKVKAAINRCQGETIDLELVRLFIQERGLRLMWSAFCIYDLILCFIAPPMVIVVIAVVLLTYSAYAQFAANTGGKKLHERAKAKLKELWDRAKDIVPSPLPAPTMVPVRSYNDDEYLRNLSGTYCFTHRRCVGT